MSLITFLDLPCPVRERVYRLAGLAVDNDNLLLQPAARTTCPWQHRLSDLAQTRNLLYTCRKVKEEVLFLFYSANTFYIRYDQTFGLQPIRNLAPGSLRAIKTLRVYLNSASCVQWACSGVIDGQWPYSLEVYDAPLDASSANGRARLDDWHQTARRIGSHIQPNVLDLTLSCDCADLPTAQRVVDSLLGQIPVPLAVCSIRLGRHADAQVQQLAERAAFQAIGLSPPPKPRGHFPFEALPVELCLSILEYTDLVAPMKEVAWEPNTGYHVRQRPCHCVVDDDASPLPRAQQLSRSLLDSIQDDWADIRHGHYACNFRNCIRYATRGCFCERYHSACTTSSPRCNCWRPPTAFFLVSQAVRREAQAVFFSKNRFIVFGSHINPALTSGGGDGAASAPLFRYPASIFLADVVPRDSLQHLRFLEIVFPEFEEYAPRTDPAFHDWEHTLEAVRDLLDLPLLTVRIYMKEYHYNGRRVPELRLQLTIDQGKALQHAYLDITSRLKTWADCGLRRLFVHFPWPWDFTRWGANLMSAARQGVLSGPDRKEEFLERYVMGQDYNADEVGKKTTHPSEWLIMIQRSTRLS